MKNKSLIFLLILIFTHIILSLQIKFTPWPEMLTYPWLMLKNYKLYTDIILPYSPLLLEILKFFYYISGISIFSLRIFTIFIFSSCDILIYLLIKRKMDKNSALIGVIFYIFSQLYFDGNGIWFELATLPLILLTYYFINKRYYLSAVFFGLSLLMKQNNILFIIPIFFALYKEKNKLIRFLLIAALPFLTVIIFYLFKNNFSDFWYWVIYHPIFVHGETPGFALYPTTWQLLITAIWFCPILFVFQKDKQAILWLIISLLFAFPRFGYFHLQYAIAFLSIFIPYLFRSKSMMVSFAYFFIVIYLTIRFFIREWWQPIRFFTNDVIQVRQVLETTLPPNASVYFLNVSSEYFVNSKLLPVKPWADNFPWYYETYNLQDKVIKSLNKDMVKYIIYKQPNHEGEYVPGSYMPKQIVSFIQKNYRIFSRINDSILILIRI